jgi:TonB family protein
MKIAILAVAIFFTNKPVLAQTDTVFVNEMMIPYCDENPPKYPGGMEAMKKLFADSMQYPKKAEIQKRGGRVVINFLVDTLGYSTGICVYKSAGKDVDKVAVRLVKMLKRWKPATLNNKRISYNQSLAFVFVPDP